MFGFILNFNFFSETEKKKKIKKSKKNLVIVNTETTESITEKAGKQTDCRALK